MTVPMVMLQPAQRPVIVAPSFNNDRTLSRVLRDIDAQALPVIVVNDGSVDQTRLLLQQWQNAAPERWVIHHDRNRGKGAALVSGFELARSLGFTHAITIDTDGQLSAADIPRLLHASLRSPSALIVGWRDRCAPHYPWANRLGRWASNLLLNWESGLRIADSQCGFRVYPLRRLAMVRCHAGRYGYEAELLVRAAWGGLPVAESHVSCIYDVPEGRVSHFRHLQDTIDCGLMHVRLMLRSITPWPTPKLVPHHPRKTGMIWQRLAWWFSPVQAWRAVRQNPAERSRFAAGLSLGIFVANTPLYGMQTLISLFLARRLRLNPVPVMIGSHISTPPVGPLLIAAAIAVGHYILHGTVPVLARLFPVDKGYFALIKSVILEWTVGGVACGLVLAGLAYLITRLLLRFLPVRKPLAPATRPAAPASVPAHAVAESAA